MADSFVRWPAPASGPDGPYPLVIQSHGWGDPPSGPDDGQYGGPTARQWAKEGFAVVQLAARGWGNSCGAIKSAVDGVKLGNITALLKNFQPALATLKPSDGHRDSHNDPLVQKVAEANARLTADSLTKRSPIIKALVGAGQVKIAAAMHDITTGKVTWLS